MQSICQKKKQDFPQLGSQAADQSTSQLEPETTCDLSLNCSDSYSSCSNQPVNLSKRKRTRSTSSLDSQDDMQRMWRRAICRSALLL